MTPRWTSTCTGCARVGVEVEPRADHHERVLCDSCAGTDRWRRQDDLPPAPDTDLRDAFTEGYPGWSEKHGPPADHLAKPDRYAGRRYDLAKLVAEADLEPPWRVEPVAADGHLTLLSAAGGEGKTWCGLAFAGGVAHGATVAGLRCVPGRAVIFDAENGPYVLGSRLGTLEPGLPADRVAVYDAEGLRLNDAGDRAWMLEVIRREGASLAMLDSLRTLAPDAAENDSDDMAPIVTGAKTVARQSGAAIVMFIHRGHGSADFRGSTAIRDAADLLFVLEREEEDPERRWRRRLRCAKCRIAEEPEERWLGIRSWRGLVTLEEAEPFDRGDAGADAAREDLEERVDAFVDAEGPTSKRSVRRGVTGRNPDIDEALRRLEKDGRITNTPRGGEACPTERGTPGHAPGAAGGCGVPHGEETPRRGVPVGAQPCGESAGTVPRPLTDPNDDLPLATEAQEALAARCRDLLDEDTR